MQLPIRLRYSLDGSIVIRLDGNFGYQFGVTHLAVWRYDYHCSSQESGKRTVNHL